jgi:putative phosphoesterase
LLREEALAALRGSELIVHAGDVGEPEILQKLRELAPVVAVRGNVDTTDWARALPVTAVAEAGAVLIYLLHDLNALDLDPVAAGFHVVVSGHSHKFGQSERLGVLYVNPVSIADYGGAAGFGKTTLGLGVCGFGEVEVSVVAGGSARIT